jgi:hypothetical protein
MLMHGGLAGPGSAKGVPALAGLVQRLALQFDVTVYMLRGTEPPTATFGRGRAATAWQQEQEPGPENTMRTGQPGTSPVCTVRC